MKQTPVKVRFDTSGWSLMSNAYGETYCSVGSGPAGIISAVATFRDFCTDLDAHGPFEITGPAKVEAHRLLTS